MKKKIKQNTSNIVKALTQSLSLLGDYNNQVIKSIIFLEVDLFEMTDDEMDIVLDALRSKSK